MARLSRRKQLPLLGFLLSLLSGCTAPTAPIEIEKLPACEASHVFDWPARQLHDSIPALFQSKDSRQDDDLALSQVFTDYTEVGSDTLRLQAYFMAETADSALFGKDYFTHDTSKNIYLHSFEFWKSPTYYADGKPLSYVTDFAIQLDSLGPRRTKVTVETLHPHVFHGYGGIGGICGLTVVTKEVPVVASKPEECALLAYLATQLPAPPLQRDANARPE